jgi:hypothetical protein
VGRRLALYGFVLGAVFPAVALAKAPALKQASVPSVGIGIKIPPTWASSKPTAALASQHVIAVFRAPRNGSSFDVNLNLIAVPVAPGTTIRQWMLGSQGARYLALGTLQNVTIGGVSGLQYKSAKLEALLGHPLFVDEFGFIRHGKAYLFTYISYASDRVSYESAFDASGASITWA